MIIVDLHDWYSVCFRNVFATRLTTKPKIKKELVSCDSEQSKRQFGEKKKSKAAGISSNPNSIFLLFSSHSLTSSSDKIIQFHGMSYSTNELQIDS